MELLDAVVLIERYIRNEGINKDEITVVELLEKMYEDGLEYM